MDSELGVVQPVKEISEILQAWPNCCEEEEMQAIIDDCLSVGLFDTYIYKEYGVLTSQAIQEQYHKIIIDSRRKYKLPLENFWMIKEEKEANDNEEETEERKETKETKGENGGQTNESAFSRRKFLHSRQNRIIHRRVFNHKLL